MEDDDAGVAVGDDAGEVVGLREEEAAGVGGLHGFCEGFRHKRLAKL